MKRFFLRSWVVFLGVFGLCLEAVAFCVYNDTNDTIRVTIDSLGWEKAINSGQSECWNWDDCCDSREQNLRVRVQSARTFKADLNMRAGGWIRVSQIVESVESPRLVTKAISYFDDGGVVSTVDFDPPTSTVGNRQLDFLLVGDPQYNQHKLSDDEPAWIRKLTDATMQELDDRFTANSRMRGIIVPGDLTQFAAESEFEAYKEAIGGLDEYYYDGLGNHDFDSSSFGWFVDPDDDVSEELVKWVGRSYPDDEGYSGRSTELSTNSPQGHYSWTWHDVHFIQLNLAPVDELIDGENDPRGALSYLKFDLEQSVGEGNGRPVVLIMHYGFDPFTFPQWWGGGDTSAADARATKRVTDFWNAIRNYNVAAIFSGHVHTASTWQYDFGEGLTTEEVSHLNSDALPRRDGRKTIPNFITGGACNESENYFLEAKIEGESFTLERFKVKASRFRNESTISTSSVESKTVDLFWDDHSDLRNASATELEENVEVGGSIFDLNDQDVFRFELSQTEDVVLEIDGFFTMRTRVYDASGNVIHDLEDGGGFRIEDKLPAGTYYVMNSTRATTPWRAFGDFKMAFRLGNPQVVVNPSSGFQYTVARGAGTIAENFQVQNQGDGTLYWSIEDDPAYWWVDFYPSEGEIGPSNQELVQFVALPETVGPGTYAIPIKVVDSIAQVEDTITLTVVVTGPADDFTGRGAAASELPGGLGGSIAGEFEVTSDKDFFRFEVTEAGTVEFFTESSFVNDTGIRLEIFNDNPGITNGERLLSQLSSGSGENEVIVRYYLEPGLYNVALGSVFSTGGYTLFSNFYPGTEEMDFQLFRDGNEADLFLMSGSPNSHILMSSPDMKRWNYWDVDGGGYNLFTPYGVVWRTVPMDQEEQFFRVVASPRAPVIAGRLFTSGSAVGSASFYQKNGVPGVSIGEPANFADTTITLGGDSLRQRDGVMMASGHHWGDGLPGVIRVPGELTDTVDPNLFFPNGTWFASNHPSGNEITSILSYAHFPYENGWQGGYVNEYGEVLAGNRANPFPIVHLSTGLFSTQGGGKPSEGALFVISPEDTGVQVVSTLANSDDTWGIAVRGAVSAVVEDGSIGYLYLPYATENVAAGQVDASGQVVHGTGGFTVTKQADHYEIRLTGDLDASKGIMLVNACQDEGNEPADNHFGWKLEGEVLKVWSYDLPLTSPPSFEACGFSFAFIPTDRLIFHPNE